MFINPDITSYSYLYSWSINILYNNNIKMIIESSECPVPGNSEEEISYTFKCGSWVQVVYLKCIRVANFSYQSTTRYISLE